MNNVLQSLPRGAAMVAAVGLMLSPLANAQVTFSYEDTVSGHAIGSSFTGPFRINLQLFDNGTLYPNLGAPGTAAGYGQNGTGPQTADGGAATLDALQTAGATGAVGNEDTWGIGRIISITDLAGSVVWSEAQKNQQITIMFYGEEDIYVNQLANGFQEINGRNAMVDLYVQDKDAADYTQYNPLLGSGGRGGIDQYATVTDGVKFLSARSQAGFLHPDGTLGGTAAEFSSIYNQSSGGTGQMYLSVMGGTMANEFNTDYFSSPFINGVNADLFAQFTTVVNSGDGAVADWLVRGNDPVTGNFAPIPEPSTYGLIGAGVLLGLVALRRRMQKRA